MSLYLSSHFFIFLIIQVFIFKKICLLMLDEKVKKALKDLATAHFTEI